MDDHGDHVGAAAQRLLVVLERWPHLQADVAAVGGEYSQSKWRPVLGPFTWDLWEDIAHRLERRPRYEVRLVDLGRRWGCQPEAVSWALLRLARYDLARPMDNDHWRVRLRCPALYERLAQADPAPALQEPLPGTRRWRPWPSLHAVGSRARRRRGQLASRLPVLTGGIR